RFHLAEERYPFADVAVGRLFGKLEIAAEMPRLGFAQPEVKRRYFAILQRRRERLEAFAGTRLDEGADDKDIHQPFRFAASHVTAQTLGITCRGQVPEGDAAPFHQLQHLLEVPQLLARQARHALHQGGSLWITEHEIERR